MFYQPSLNADEINYVLTSNCLEDTHIDYFHFLLSQQTTFRPQSVLLYQNSNLIVEQNQAEKHLQIIFDNEGNSEIGHWICIFYDSQVLHIYDSLKKAQLRRDHQTYIDRLFPFHPPVIIEKVQQQRNGIDCGLFSIAFAVSVALNIDPTKQYFKENSMRQHIFDMFMHLYISPFPIDLRQKRLDSQNESKKRKREEKKEKIFIEKKMKNITLINNEGKLSINCFRQGKLNDSVTPHYIGDYKIKCRFCKSLNFPSENRYSTLCCRKGKLFHEFIKYPDLLCEYLTLKNEYSKRFRENIRQINNVFAFASFGGDIIKNYGGPYMFKVHGQVYHQLSTLYPEDGNDQKFAQLYVLDSEEATTTRWKNNSNLSKVMLVEIDNLIRKINPFSKIYKNMKEKEIEMIKNGNFGNFCMHIIKDRSKDLRRYDLPTSNEIAVVFSSDDGAAPKNRDICVYARKQEKITKISELSENCDPLCYPLLFPYGEPGWSIELRNRKNVTLLQYYLSKIFERDFFNPLIHSGKLSQQFLIDSYLKVEGNNLRFIRNNQEKLRVELYSGLMDHLHNKIGEEKCGKPCILPSSFNGSPRCMQQRHQDGMAIVRTLGKPDLFLTMTCNPKWPEIVNNLGDGESPNERPDLIARVFFRKVIALLDDLRNKKIFGNVIGFIYTIEWQKRGLPHIHLLLFLSSNSKIRNAEDVDKIVSAEIPNKDEFPNLYDAVVRHMIHTPCGLYNEKSSCMIDNKCSKHFPKQRQEKTVLNGNGYPQYKRRFMNTVNMKGLEIDDGWVVPYNPGLLLRYDAHFNVEICSSLKSIKYICKYIHKGHDCATIEIEGGKWDEIKMYLDTRYICAPEAVHRLFEFDMHATSHAVIRLQVHLPLEQQVYFKEGEEKKALEKASKFDTQLTAWFKLNRENASARNYSYQDIPHHFVWETKEKKWKPRQRCKKPVISRLYSVSVRDKERFYLRLLLLYVKGAKSFEDLRSYKGKIYGSFEEVAIARKIVSTDEEWDDCLEEASTLKFPKEIRELFAFILSFALPVNSNELWEKYKYSMYEDYLRIHEEKIAESKALKEIESILETLGYTLEYFKLPSTDVEIEIPLEISEQFINHLNDEQKSVFDLITTAIYSNACKTNIFFMDGAAGTGKTFIYNAINQYCEENQISILSVASTGIAATLLKNGRTSHSAFNIPLILNETSICKAKTKSFEMVIKNSKIIIWDEVTMSHIHAIMAVDRYLQDIHNNKTHFGGKIVLFGGDFRQCLPVVKKASRTEIMESSIKNSSIFWEAEKLFLRKNMRVSEQDNSFSKWIKMIGDGDMMEITIPKECRAKNKNDLISRTFDFNSSEDQCMNAILCSTNESCFELNDLILSRLKTKEKVYLSVDTIESDVDDQLTIPTETLNSFTPTGMPPHRLCLKIGAVVMILRNLNIKQGICNGTKLVVQRLHNHIIEGMVITGKRKGEKVLIPRIDIESSPTDFAFKMKRRQFPVRVSYAMTINKSQGQTFNKVGIDLTNPIFTHGQLYVALSRIRSKDKLCILGPEKIRNCVFKEILN